MDKGNQESNHEQGHGRCRGKQGDRNNHNSGAGLLVGRLQQPQLPQTPDLNVMIPAHDDEHDAADVPTKEPAIAHQTTAVVRKKKKRTAVGGMDGTREESSSLEGDSESMERTQRQNGGAGSMRLMEPVMLYGVSAYLRQECTIQVQLMEMAFLQRHPVVPAVSYTGRGSRRKPLCTGQC